MPTELISPDEFLTRLSACFANPPSEAETSSVWMTHKRYTRADAEGGDDIEMADANESAGPSSSASHYQVLVRCTFGTTKFSTKIPASQLPTFHARYGSLLKASMAGAMRKRDKKKEKARAEALAKRTREVYEDIKLGEDGKRGKGRRQRQRKAKAQQKRETERERIENRASAASKVET